MTGSKENTMYRETRRRAEGGGGRVNDEEPTKGSTETYIHELNTGQTHEEQVQGAEFQNQTGSGELRE